MPVTHSSMSQNVRFVRFNMQRMGRTKDVEESNHAMETDNSRLIKLVGEFREVFGMERLTWHGWGPIGERGVTEHSFS